jgi:3-mercaptopyruvate sulfurtransferase SseA
MLTPESQVVVYCDGKECELSHRLADSLRQVGYTNVHMLFNGWTVWKESGFPIEQGERR